MSVIARSLLVTWVVLWSTSRHDVVMHLIGWIIIGSGTCAFFRDKWLGQVPLIFDMVETTSEEIREILPDSDVFIKLFSFAICGMAAFFLAGAESKSKSGPFRGSWLVFALARILLPISACTVDFSRDPTEAVLTALFTLLSLVGPLSSWPSRSFALSDIVYAIIINLTGQVCSAQEAALVAAVLALAHDAVHTRFLYFMEAAAFTVALIFIIENTIMVLFSKNLREESWHDALDIFGNLTACTTYFVERAPPALVTAWATGMFLRTFTQGRLDLKELLGCLAVGIVFGAAVLYSSKDPIKLASQPSFACTTVFVAMGCASRMAAGRKRILKKNQYIFASGFFSSLLNDQDDEDEPPVAEEVELSLQEQISLVVDTQQHENVEEHVSIPKKLLQKLSSSRSVQTPIAQPDQDTFSDSKEIEQDPVEILNREYEHEVGVLKALESRHFYLVALSKGLATQEERDVNKGEIAKMKEMIEASRQRIAMLSGKLEDRKII